MALHPPSTRRERILAYGQSGAGKSWIWLMIAEWIYKTGADAIVYVIDTDNGWDALRPEDGHLDQIVRPFPIHTWDDYVPAVKEARDKGRSQDWLVIDRADKVWEAAQEGFFEKAFGEELDEFFLNNPNPGGDYGKNWVQIRRMYNFVMNQIPRFRGHVLGIAAARQIRKPEEGKKRTQFDDDPETVAKYERVGWKPEGEDKLAHLFFTQIMMVEGRDKWLMNIITDKGRREREYGVEVNKVAGFVMSYLMMRAGWKA